MCFFTFEPPNLALQFGRYAHLKVSGIQYAFFLSFYHILQRLQYLIVHHCHSPHIKLSKEIFGAGSHGMRIKPRNNMLRSDNFATSLPPTSLSHTFT
jgi:hypothetical protein